MAVTRTLLVVAIHGDTEQSDETPDCDVILVLVGDTSDHTRVELHVTDWAQLATLDLNANTLPVTIG